MGARRPGWSAPETEPPVWGRAQNAHGGGKMDLGGLQPEGTAARVAAGRFVTTKRGFGPFPRCSAFATTRRATLPQEQSAAVRGDRAPVKTGHHGTPFQGVEIERQLFTLYGQGLSPFP